MVLLESVLLCAVASASGSGSGSLGLFAVGGVFGSFLTLTMTELYKCIRQSKRTAQIHVDWSMRARLNSDSMNLDDSLVVPNLPFCKSLIHILELRTGGVFVVGAPAGSGKTTYVIESIKKFMASNKRCVKYVRQANCASSSAFKSMIGMPPGGCVSEYLPAGSVVVIDQIDFDVITSEMAAFIIELATESRNTKAFHVILCVSSATMMNSILELNGGEKIVTAVASKVIEWDEDQISALATFMLKGWLKSDVDQVVKALAISKSAGTVWSWCNKFNQAKYTQWADVKEESRLNMLSGALKKQQMWETFTLSSGNPYILN